MTKRRLILVLIIAAAAALVGQVFVRRQWLRYRREQSLAEISTFISNSQNFDSATEAALSLVQEVELVSRGYRMSVYLPALSSCSGFWLRLQLAYMMRHTNSFYSSLPLPPVSRIEERTQSRKCVRLRKALKNSFAGVLQTYNQVSDVVRGFAEQMELEKYYDMYDVSDFDISDSRLGFNESEFEDSESLRTLKILAARFHTTRKMLLCALLALDANGEAKDLLRWTAAVEALQSANVSTKSVFEKLQGILSEEECKPPFFFYFSSLFMFTSTDNILTTSSFPFATYSVAASNTRKRAMALPGSQAQFHVDWNSRPASQTPSTARRIR